LVVILLTSFVQSLDPEAGFRYFLLLLVETIVVIAWSAQQQRKAPFLIGAGGVLANVVGQVVVVFLGEGALIRWLIFGGLGLIILLAAIFAERWVIPRAKEVRERLEGWA
jgi:Na+/melibiose symporter-like transporter